MSLNHPNIAPLLGLISEELGPGLVSPWYSYGNILEYIKQGSNVQREPLVICQLLSKLFAWCPYTWFSVRMWQTASDISMSKFRPLCMET